MQAVAEVPDDAIAMMQLMCTEDRCKLNIERQYLTVIDIVSNLPAQATGWFEPGDQLVDDLGLPKQVVFEC